MLLHCPHVTRWLKGIVPLRSVLRSTELAVQLLGGVCILSRAVAISDCHQALCPHRGRARECESEGPDDPEGTQRERAPFDANFGTIYGARRRGRGRRRRRGRRWWG